jgi:hypothetical protein
MTLSAGKIKMIPLRCRTAVCHMCVISLKAYRTLDDPNTRGGTRVTGIVLERREPVCYADNLFVGKAARETQDKVF